MFTVYIQVSGKQIAVDTAKTEKKARAICFVTRVFHPTAQRIWYE